MGIKKSIELPNGIVLNYHRIVTLNKVTNRVNLIEIASYIDKKQRDKEVDLYNQSVKQGEAIESNIYIHTTYIRKEYNENEMIKDVYEYLKTTDEFKDAEDI